jgi:hypothetical protein
MSLQEILARHVPEHPELENELESYLSDRLSEGGAIPKSRFDEVISQRNVLREQLQELSRELTALHGRLDGQSESEALREENEKLTRQVVQGLQREWDRFAPLFELEPTHPLHERVARIREDFAFPEGEWTVADYERNLEAIQPYLKADYFHQPEPPEVDGAKPVSPGDAPAAHLNDLFKGFGG